MGDKYIKDGKVWEKGDFIFPDRVVGEIKTGFGGQPTQVNPTDLFTAPYKIDVDKSSGKVDVHKDHYFTGTREGFTIEKDMTYEHNQKSTDYSYPLYPKKTSDQEQSGGGSDSGFSSSSSYGGEYSGSSVSSVSSSTFSDADREKAEKLGILLAFLIFFLCFILPALFFSPPASTPKKNQTTLQNAATTQMPQTTESVPLPAPNQESIPNQEIKVEKETLPEEITNRNTEVLPRDDSISEPLSPSVEFRTLNFNASYVNGLTLTNDTEEYLPVKITQYPSYPFEIAENNCQNGFAPHTSCKILLKFRRNDAEYGSLEGDLYKGYASKIIVDMTKKKVDADLTVLVFYKGSGKRY